jgi:hypothetical protein
MFVPYKTIKSMATFNNGKIIVSDTSIQVKGMFGQSKVIQKKHIKSVSTTGNMLLGIVALIFIIGAYNGIMMLRGFKSVKLKQYDTDEGFEFWIPASEVAAFRAEL